MQRFAKQQAAFEETVDPAPSEGSASLAQADVEMAEAIGEEEVRAFPRIASMRQHRHG